ncbi:MAG: hypothetical protein Q9163_006126 [Psora crenata]
MVGWDAVAFTLVTGFAAFQLPAITTTLGQHHHLYRAVQNKPAPTSANLVPVALRFPLEKVDMSAHSHSHSASSGSSTMAMSSSNMEMVFHTSTTSPLFSLSWRPTGTGSYAGTCIFLIFLAAILRGLFAGKHFLERKWLDRALERRYIKIRGTPTEADRIDASADGKYGTLVTAKGVEQHVKVVANQSRPVMPWRLSVDVPRAIYVTITAGVGYLVMLAVMTMNVGYFLSVLGGIFVGELLVGRYAQLEEH